MIMDDNRENNFLTAGEISKCLRIPLNSIYRLTKRGIIKGVKIGKQWRYNKTDFEKYLAGEIDSRNIHIEKYKERRAYPRMNCNFKCKSEVKIIDQKDFFLTEGHISNISANGVFLVSNNLNKINIGDPIDIDFDLTSDIDEVAHNIHVKGRVVRKTYIGFGVKFRHIDENYKNLITEFVD